MRVEYHSCQSYDRDAIAAAVTTMLEPWGGFAGLLAGRQRILLKPNFVAPEGLDGCSTTHPAFYMAIAGLLLDAGKDVTIADSPAFGSAAMQVRLHGVYGECRKRGIGVLTFRKATESAGVKGDKTFGELTIARELRQFDALVNLPKLKVHSQFVFTGATKNLYGCVTGKRKAYRHFVCENDPVRFARMILANSRAAAPVLNIADGIVSMHRKGPRGGAPYPLAMLAASDNTLALDWLFCRRIGLDPLATPLYQAIAADEPELLDDLEAACARWWSDPVFAADGSGAPGYEMSPKVDIAFTAGKLVRSVWKSLKTGS